MKFTKIMAAGLTLTGAQITNEKFERNHLYKLDAPVPVGTVVDPDDPPPKYEYSPDLNCGECISRGYNFCWRIDGV